MTGGPEDTAPKHASRWKKGQSGNPAGRPKGRLNKTTMLLQALIDDEGEGVVRAMIQAAKDGDVTAGKAILDRLVPPRKDRPVSFGLPVIEDTGDAADALGAVLQAVADGEVTPGEAQAVAAVVETWRRTIETAELEARITALEGARSK